MNRIFFGLIVIFLLSFPIFAVSAGGPAPGFNLAGKSGNVKLSDFSDQVVYVDFWASWCVPCRKSFPWMNKMQAKYGDLGFQVIAINLDKERELAEQFLKVVPADISIAFDPEGKVATQYQVRGMPSSYLIGRDGKIHFEHLGFRDNKTSEMENQIKKLIRQ